MLRRLVMLRALRWERGGRKLMPLLTNTRFGFEKFQTGASIARSATWINAIAAAIESFEASIRSFEASIRSFDALITSFAIAIRASDA